MQSTKCSLLFIIAFAASQLAAQQHEEFILESGERNLDRIDQLMRQESRRPGGLANKKATKFYQRWKHNYAPRLDENGDIFNHASHNYREMRSFLRSQPDQIYQPADQRNVHGLWENVTPGDYNLNRPSNGRVNCISIHPTNNNIIYVGTPVGGLWKSYNGGTTWVDLTPGMDNLGVTSIVILPSNPNHVYILTGSGDGWDCPSMGVFRSVDGGYNWLPTDLFFEDHQVKRGFKMIMHPTDYNKMYAVFEDGVYLTDDYWQTHTHVLVGYNMRDIEFVPGTPDTMYASSTSEVFISNIGGYAWTALDSTIGLSASDDWNRVALATVESHPGVVYALYADNVPDSIGQGYHELYFSATYGNSWQLQDSGYNLVSNQCHYNLELLIEPGAPQTLYVGTVDLDKSTDWGNTFTRIANDPGLPDIHADVHELAWRDGVLYTGTDGGISKSTNGGSSFTNISDGLTIMQVYDIDVKGTSIMAGSQDNGTNQWNIGASQADFISGGDGMECIFDPTANIRYVSTQGSRKKCDYDVFPSQCWVSITPPDHADIWESALELHRTDFDTIYSAEHTLKRNFNRGAFPFWTDIDPGWTEDWRRIEAICQGHDDPGRMYATNTKQIKRTSNVNASAGSVTWTDVTNGLPTGHPYYLRMGEITVDPQDADRVWVTMFGYSAGNKVFFSSNGGDSWINISGNLPNVPVYTIEYLPGSNDLIYVGTDFGVFYKDAGMQSWAWFSNGLPKTRVDDMKVTDDYLYVGTFGRGVWRSPHAGSCPLLLTISEATDPSLPHSSGTQVHSASLSITSTQVISGGQGAHVTYRAGGLIFLNPGFHAKQLSEFDAVLDGCPD